MGALSAILKTKTSFIKKMYYNRIVSEKFIKLFENNGDLRWLFDFVKNNEKLDFFIGSNKSKNKTKEWISIYYGLTRILSIFLIDDTFIRLNADKKYKDILPSLYGKRNITENFQYEIESLISKIDDIKQFERYYKNRKEGYYQSELSRKYGICGSEFDEFVIIDKEVVFGYSDIAEKNDVFGNIQSKYKDLQRKLSTIDPKRYGKDLWKKSIGNELDFLALDKSGNLLLIEYKHGTNTSGIYLSPLQIGLYREIFLNFPKNKLEIAVFNMFEQKQKIGLINPYWKKPNFIKDIIPVLIISENNNKSSAKNMFFEIMNICKIEIESSFLRNIIIYNYTSSSGLTKWELDEF